MQGRLIDTGGFKYGLAPMEGITDFPARVWFYLVSAPDFVSTPFLRLGENFPKYDIPAQWCPEILVPELAQSIPYQCIPQFMSPEPQFVVSSARKLLELTPFVDLNCGCPAPKAVGKGAGSSLLINSKRFEAFLAEVVGGIGGEHLSMKMRVGYHDAHSFLDLLGIVGNLKIRRLSVHGRTRDQGYLGHADWKLISQASTLLSVPVIGSGDIQDQRSLQARIDTAPSLAGVIIGRGALRNPWIFDELSSGTAAAVDLRALPYALAVFALLNDKFLSDFPALCAAVSMVCTTAHPAAMYEKWQSIFGQLVRAWYDRGLSLYEVEVARRSLGRLKLLWGYMRTALPAVFFHPPLMRARTLGEFLEGIESLSAAHRRQSGEGWVQPTLDPTLDWMFSGERRRKGPAEKQVPRSQ